MTERVIVQPAQTAVVRTDAPERVVVTDPNPAVIVAPATERVVVEREPHIIRTYEGATGPQGEKGPPGDPGPVEIYDSAIAPVGATFPYLRFERDLDGDVQAIYLGTVT